MNRVGTCSVACSSTRILSSVMGGLASHRLVGGPVRTDNSSSASPLQQRIWANSSCASRLVRGRQGTGRHGPAELPRRLSALHHILLAGFTLARASAWTPSRDPGPSLSTRNEPGNDDFENGRLPCNEPGSPSAESESLVRCAPPKSAMIPTPQLLPPCLESFPFCPARVMPPRVASPHPAVGGGQALGESGMGWGLFGQRSVSLAQITSARPSISLPVVRSGLGYGFLGAASAPLRAGRRDPRPINRDAIQASRGERQSNLWPSGCCLQVPFQGASRHTRMSCHRRHLFPLV